MISLGHQCVWNHWQLDCLFNRSFMPIRKNTLKLRITDPLWGESTGFPHQGSTLIFSTNLGVGQPSNNIDFSEIKIYLGRIIYVFLQRKKSGRTLIKYIYYNYEKYPLSPLKPKILALIEQYPPNISDPVYSVHQSFTSMWFLWLNCRKSTFYPVMAPND